MQRAKGKMRTPVLAGDVIREIVNTLFPHVDDSVVGVTRTHLWQEAPPPFTYEELLGAASRIKEGKAPGPDFVPNVALKCAIRTHPDMFLYAYNSCLRLRKFYDAWKIQRLVLVPKPGRPPGLPSSYRPLCLIDGVAKIMEHMVKCRLERIIDEHGGLSDNQYGFRKARSTVDALRRVREFAVRSKKAGSVAVMISYDVRNAFNTARWSRILSALGERGVPAYLLDIIRDYLIGRVLRYAADGEWSDRVLTAGVPQGSVLGPLLWNVMYDGLLRLPLKRAVEVVGYADDVAVLVSASTPEILARKVSGMSDAVEGWITRNGLTLAASKTEVLVLAGARRLAGTTLNVLGSEVPLSNAVRYLGVLVDTGLTFLPHVQQVCVRAQKIAGSLAGIMPNIGGPGEIKRRLLCGVVTSVMVYAAPVWTLGGITHKARKMMEDVQRSCALRITRAYRTVATEVLLVLASFPPADIVAEVRASFYNRKRQVGNGELGQGFTQGDMMEAQMRAAMRDETLAVWQRRWTAGNKGRWTREILLDFLRWVDRPHGLLNYHLTQALTGHGCFGDYLHRIGKERTAECWFCAEGVDDVRHTLFECPRWDEEREMACRAVGSPITPENMVGILLNGSRESEVINAYISGILKTKEAVERSRERSGVRTARYDADASPERLLQL